MRVCILFDCLYPYTVGGAERWYRNLAERLAAAGHEVTYLTLRQWEGPAPDLGERIEVVAVGPRLPLYTAGGRRRIGPALRYALGVGLHLLRHPRRYAALHTNATPFFPLLVAGTLQPLLGYRLAVDYHELWTAAYWREYLGPAGGTVAHLIQTLCLRFRQRAFCFSRLHERRLREGKVNGPITLLEGEYAGPTAPPAVRPPGQAVLFAARLIPEKRPLLALQGFAHARQLAPELRLTLLGRGPLEAQVAAEVERLGLGGVVELPGFVPAGEVERLMAESLALLSTSSREGYGMVVVEACAAGTPAIVVAGPDNASCELIEVGVNGYVVAAPTPELVGEAILRVRAGGLALRERTAGWFARNANRLSLQRSLTLVLAAYDAP